MASEYSHAILFDVDGTLIDSNYLHTLSWWQALRQQSFTAPAAALHRAIGMGGEELIRHILGNGTSPIQTQKLIDAHDAIFSTYWPALLPFESAAALLEHCALAGAAVVLASSAEQTELEVLRKALDADHAIAASTSSSDAAQGKPSPDILAAALKSVGVDTTHALFVGDAVWDAKAAAALGIPMIGVRSGGTSAAELYEAGAVEVFDDVRELLDKVDQSRLGTLLQAAQGAVPGD
ncbi:hypothetical protein ART_3542 [Arthrobacter sp. PAMC 25486]|uniref:HAD family hydrolase n=1 Tax=Arthrobacter sp. PAMC 25486 TaxID=1494608 RepID=UPI0005363F7E|nr:HAD family hydrolase [Arthrobacter sp. PAMC 25486]AIY03141.1 hypothetical protein ART_3542 [Arthrobacter sp. PAMC 25486]